ncbi:hypothetical protein L1076_08255 [Vibrio sp. MMG022]|nr:MULTISPECIES: hypothetical protein [Vibrio]MCF6451584.1 hypothetical protein [Vibrio sp. MMG023]UQA50393.1 hypothetical protein ITG12_14765 [Vibrio sp. ED002]
MQYSLEEILHYLNDNHFRASNKAVAEILGVSVWSLIYKLDKCHPAGSWLVDDKTGLPVGYSSKNYHPHLFQRRVILSSVSVLRQHLLHQYAR